MHFRKSTVERIIREELMNHIKSLVEVDGAPDDASDDDVEPKKKGKRGPGRPPKDPETTDAAQAPPKKPKGDGPPKVPPPDDETPADSEIPQDDGPAPEVPDEPDPADDEIAAAVDGEDEDQRGGGEVSGEVVGKRIQSITLEPKSKLVPGAQELVLTFDEVVDPLRILVTKTGVIRFWFRGLHNSL